MNTRLNILANAICGRSLKKGVKYQRVASVSVLESFPRNVAGKTLKREIRKRYLEEL